MPTQITIVRSMHLYLVRRAMHDGRPIWKASRMCQIVAIEAFHRDIREYKANYETMKKEIELRTDCFHCRALLF